MEKVICKISNIGKRISACFEKLFTFHSLVHFLGIAGHGAGVNWRMSWWLKCFEEQVAVHPADASQDSQRPEFSHAPFLPTLSQKSIISFNPTDATRVAGSPRIGVGPGFDSQGSVTFFNKYCFPNLY